VTANVDGLSVAGGVYYLSFAQDVTIGGVTYQDEDIVMFTPGATPGTGTWSVYFDGTGQGLTATNLDVDAMDVAGGVLRFSTVGNTNPPVGGTADDADVYSWNGTSFARILDASAVGVPTAVTANMDGLSVEGSIYYVSFAEDVTIAGTTYQDEDILAFDSATGTWSTYFDGTARGLTASNQDIDDFDVVGGIIYFSTLGNTNPPGVGGTADDADVYSWNGTSFARVLDVSAEGVPTAVTANVDGLSVAGGVYYLSFAQDVTIGGVIYQDEDILRFTPGATPGTGTWSVYFDGTGQGLTAGGQDIDAIQVQ
jgi:hypothetical protein